VLLFFNRKFEGMDLTRKSNRDMQRTDNRRTQSNLACVIIGSSSLSGVNNDQLPTTQTVKVIDEKENNNHLFFSMENPPYHWICNPWSRKK
jgi:hypothetical protein